MKWRQVHATDNGRIGRAGITYLSFWDVELVSFPAGAFKKRLLTAAEARDRVDTARAAGRLVFVARDDLGAPYRARGSERHVELCAPLRGQVELRLEGLIAVIERDHEQPVAVRSSVIVEWLRQGQAVSDILARTGLDTPRALQRFQDVAQRMSTR